jgi:Integrase core domain
LAWFKPECIRTTVFHDGPYKTLADVEYATAGWVDWYNNRRLHEALQLAQQATLETRDAKHEPRSLVEQRATWLQEAAAVLDGPEAVASMVQTALAPPAETATIADSHWVAQTADHILTVMEKSRSTWQMWHVRAEAQRQVRTTGVMAERASALVDLLVDEVLDRRSVALAAPADNVEEPEVLRRVDGSSVYTVAGADLYTSQRILDAEQRLVTTAGRRDGSAVDDSAVDLALLEMAANKTALDAGQASLVRQMCTSGARLQLAIGPGRRWENHRHARPDSRLDPRRRSGARPGPVGCRGRRPRREHRHPHRHPRQTHLVP